MLKYSGKNLELDAKTEDSEVVVLSSVLSISVSPISDDTLTGALWLGDERLMEM